jgi:sugar phosphate isomerase/epimerase
MKLSVSNIGWSYDNLEYVIPILKFNGINYIDVAPSLLHDKNKPINIEEVNKFYLNNDIKFAGMQSLFFNAPNISIFDGDDNKLILDKYLENNCFLAKNFKIQNLVFGSPKNRIINDFNKFTLQKAKNIYKELSDLAKQYSCILCLEPNPKEYGCNFITNTFEAIEFVKSINSPNLKINLDISTTILNNEDLDLIFKLGKEHIQHVHISAPYLTDITQLDHKNIIRILNKYQYSGYIVMECLFKNNSLVDLEKNIKCFVKNYR